MYMVRKILLRHLESLFKLGLIVLCTPEIFWDCTLHPEVLWVLALNYFKLLIFLQYTTIYQQSSNWKQTTLGHGDGAIKRRFHPFIFCVPKMPLSSGQRETWFMAGESPLHFFFNQKVVVAWFFLASQAHARESRNPSKVMQSLSPN